MPTTYNLAPTPRWIFNDLIGQPLGLGFMYTYRADNRSIPAPVYSDSGGLFPYANPVLWGANGMRGPFYWDSSFNYYIEVRDIFGVLQFFIDNFNAPITGGGANVTSNINFNNFIANGQLLYNIGQTASPIGANQVQLAPTSTELLNYATVCPLGISFSKNNTSATDQVTFTQFALGDTSCFSTPEFYTTYSCTVAGSSEGFKYYIYPLAKDVRSLEGQIISASIMAKSSSLSPISITLLQFFGDGGSPSASVTTDFATPTLTNSFLQYNGTITVPSVGAKTLGACGNDACYLLIQMPLNQTCNISHTNVQVILGSLNPVYQYLTRDLVAMQLFKPKTGQIKMEYGVPFEPGWINLSQKGIIGNANTGIITSTSRSNIDTFNLFSFLWNNTTNSECAVYNQVPVTISNASPAVFTAVTHGLVLNDSIFLTVSTFGSIPTGLAIDTEYFVIAAGLTANTFEVSLTMGGAAINTSSGGSGSFYFTSTTPQARGASAVEDFTANRILALPTVAGSAFASIGTVQGSTFINGQNFGEVDHALMGDENGPHTHTYSNFPTQENKVSGGTNFPGDPDGSVVQTSGSSGLGTPHNTMQPTTFLNVFIKL